MSTRYSCGGAVVVLAIALLIGVPLGGLVLSNYWRWFVMPVFEGLPAIGVGQAIGISMFVKYITLDTSEADRDATRTKADSDIISTAIATSVGLPLLALLFGWIFHQIIG